MGASRQPDRHVAQSNKTGHSLAQSVVELECVSHNGLVFWSRHHFDITAELQLRLHRRALKGAAWAAGLKSHHGWLLLRGFVVQCQPSRRDDGTVGFQIAIVFDPALVNAATSKNQDGGLINRQPKPGKFGLN